MKSEKLPSENRERIRAQRSEQELLLPWGQGGALERRQLWRQEASLLGSSGEVEGAVRWRFTGSNFFCSRVIQEERQSYSFGTPQKSPSKAKALIKYLIPQAGIIKSCVLKSGVQNIFWYVLLVSQENPNAYHGDKS